ncbi:MAG: twin-arginine translocase TatA/TatE family subunit [Nitrospinaceae bacterium]
MMGIGFPELMIILVIIMIIFGAGKLPDIGNAFGKSIKNFKQSMKEAEEVSVDDSSKEVSGDAAAVSTEGAEAQAAPTTNEAAKKKEEEIIDEAALEIEKNRIGTIKTPHDGLVQQRDVFTESLNKVPGGRSRSRGVTRDIF